MIKAIKLYPLLFLFLYLTFSGLAQPTFYAHVDDEKVYRGTFFKIEYQLSDARGSKFTPPSFSDFKVAAGPSRTYQTSIVNGKVNSYEGYSYTVQALKEGDFIIPAASIVVKGKRLRSNPLHITVLAPLKQDDLLGSGPPSGQEYFLVAEINRDTAYAGQQILLDYRIFTKKNIEKVDFKQLPDLTNFHWMGLYLINESVEQVEISGEIYSTKLLKRFAIFPKRPGVYSIDPAQLLLMIPKPKKRGFFFDNYETKYINSNAHQLTVLPLPVDKPKKFSGLVGSYAMESSSPRLRLTTDDALTIRMRIKGNGDANRLTIPTIDAPNKLESYDPKIISRNKDQNQKKRDHFAVIEYLFTASEPGRYVVQPEFNYFDPDSSDFVTLHSDPFIFNVSRGSGLNRSETIDTAISYELVEALSSRQGGFMIYKSGWQYTWLGLLCTALILSFLQFRRNQKAQNTPPKTRRELALAELDELALQENPEIAHRIEEIIGDYFRQELNIEESAWSVASLSTHLSAAGFDNSIIANLIDLLEKCKFAAYSGTGGDQQRSWINQAKELIQ